MESAACAHSQKKNQQGFVRCCRVIKKTIRSHVVQFRSQGKHILMGSFAVAVLVLLVMQMHSRFHFMYGHHRQSSNSSRNPNPWTTAFYNMMRSFWEQTLQKLWDVLRFLVITTCIGYGILNSSGWNSDQNAGNCHSKCSAQVTSASSGYGDESSSRITAKEEDVDSNSYNYVNLLDSKKPYMSYASPNVDIIHASINEEEEEETETAKSVIINDNGILNESSEQHGVAAEATADLSQADISASPAKDVEIIDQKTVVDVKNSLQSAAAIRTNTGANYASGCDSEYSADDEGCGTFSSTYQYYYGNQFCTPLQRSGRLRRTHKHNPTRLQNTNLAAAVATSMALKHSEINSDGADDAVYNTINLPAGLQRDRRANSADCLFKDDVKEFWSAVEMEKLRMVGRTVSADESALRAAAASAMATASPVQIANCHNFNYRAAPGAASILISGRTASADEAGLRASAAAAMATAGTALHKSSSSGTIFEEEQVMMDERKNKKNSRSALNLADLVRQKSRSRRTKHNYMITESAIIKSDDDSAPPEPETLLKKKSMTIADAKKALRDSLVPWRSATGASSSTTARSSCAASSSSAISQSSADQTGSKSPASPNITASPGRIELNKKADDFIARFHQRMRLQRLESLERRRNSKI